MGQPVEVQILSSAAKWFISLISDFSVSEPIVYTGGPLVTHAYLLPAEEAATGSSRPCVCFDAPQGLLDFVTEQDLSITHLVLTHGHFDHIWDAAAIARRFGCPIYAHPGDFFILQDTKVFERMGFEFQIEPVENPIPLAVPSQGAADVTIAGREWRAFHIPGHSPGSVAFYSEADRYVIGGDVLFSGGVGRWDLPLGSKETLIDGIRRHLLALPGGTIVYPGHGPATTIEREAATNPYLTEISVL